MSDHRTPTDDTPKPSPVRAPRPLRFILGLHERLVINGVRYKELTQDPLRRALSRRGVGYKEYAVRFPQGRRMRIKVTPYRWFEDLTGPVTLPLFKQVEHLIRPGSRLLALRAGTGFAPAYLAERVGPSGAVVCITDDQESVRYARWRYPRENVAYEDTAARPPHADLGGETDGSFDAALLVNTLRQPDDAVALLAECMRVVATGGWIYLVAPTLQETPDPLAPVQLTKAAITKLVAKAHDQIGEDSPPCFIRWLELDAVTKPPPQDTQFQLTPHLGALLRLGESPEQSA